MAPPRTLLSLPTLFSVSGLSSGCPVSTNKIPPSAGGHSQTRQTTTTTKTLHPNQPTTTVRANPNSCARGERMDSVSIVDTNSVVFPFLFDRCFPICCAKPAIKPKQLHTTTPLPNDMHTKTLTFTSLHEICPSNHRTHILKPTNALASLNQSLCLSLCPKRWFVECECALSPVSILPYYPTPKPPPPHPKPHDSPCLFSLFSRRRWPTTRRTRTGGCPIRRTSCCVCPRRPTHLSCTTLPVPSERAVDGSETMRIY